MKRIMKQKIKKTFMTQTVIGIFNEENDARNAVQALRSNGFLDANIDTSNEGILREDSTARRDEDDNFGERVERFFKNLFGNDEESTRYTAAARNGLVVSVQADSAEEARLASDILDEAGAIDIDESTTMGSSSDRYASADLDDRSASLNTDERSANFDNSRTSIPVVEEDLNVGKREVETGRVRVRSRIVERPVEQTVRLREERVNVERTPTNRPASESDFATEDNELEMKTTAEIPVINKEARVVEEVRLKKDVREREEKIEDTVRRKDVDIRDSESGLDDESNNRL